MKDFPADLKEELRERPEIRIETEEDGTRHSTIIWVVVTADGVFVRSYRGPQGKWYQRVKRTGTAVLRVGRRRIPVRLEPDTDPTHNRRIDEAYQRKYGPRWPVETEAMVKPASVRRTTLRVLPA
ncbi:MAG TPA: DUF2255 family protein [Candidatus Limnocylindrales bacterium]|nr:DUF2255 family protein [Candidatus Limnocylindrales bacterium]